MNEEQQIAVTQSVELKICERCGGLWLRPAQSTWAYCAPCKARVDDLPKFRLKNRKRGQQPRLPRAGRERVQ